MATLAVTMTPGLLSGGAMHDPTLEDSNERDRIAGSWSSPVYPLVFFLVAMPLEWWLWKDAPFMQLGWQVVLGLSIVVAAVPWIGSVAHPADSAALRRHPARFAFVLPALALHLAIFALYGPYWRSGAGDGSVTIHRLVTALREPAQMSTLLVEAVARTGEDPSEVLRDIALLRRLGADVNAPAPDGRYPLDAAARPEHGRQGPGAGGACALGGRHAVKPTQGICQVVHFGQVGPCRQGRQRQRRLQKGASFHAAHGKASHLFSLAQRPLTDNTACAAGAHPRVQPRNQSAPLRSHRTTMSRFSLHRCLTGFLLLFS
jgi:hypothetical protein